MVWRKKFKNLCVTSTSKYYCKKQCCRINFILLRHFFSYLLFFVSVAFLYSSKSTIHSTSITKTIVQEACGAIVFAEQRVSLYKLKLLSFILVFFNEYLQ